MIINDKMNYFENGAREFDSLCRHIWRTCKMLRDAQRDFLLIAIEIKWIII